MSRPRGRAFVLASLAALAFVWSCTSFSPAGERGDGDGGAPPEEASTDAGPAEGAVRSDAGTFCVAGGPYDYCWDFRDPAVETGFDGKNLTGDATLRQDTEELTSAPGSLRSEVRASAPTQSAARCVQNLGPPAATGVYKLAFSMRLACVATPSSGKPTIAELFCKDSSNQERPFMAVEVSDPTLLEVKLASVGSVAGATGSVKAQIPVRTWVRVEIETTVGPAGGASVKVGDAKPVATSAIAVGCAGFNGLQLLLGVQGTLSDGSCVVNLDDVTLITP